jgi:hypothetical protein
VIAIPSDVKDKCTHLDIYQKTQSTINTCKAITGKDACKAISIKTHLQRFGTKSGCSSGGAATDKGVGFNEYTCLDECKKIGSAKCNNYLIRDNGQCILYAGTCRVQSKGTADSKIFEVYHFKEGTGIPGNYKRVGENKQC